MCITQFHHTDKSRTHNLLTMFPACTKALYHVNRVVSLYRQQVDDRDKLVHFGSKFVP